MKNVILTGILIGFSLYNVLACNVCGGGLNMSNLGLLSQYRSNHLTTHYQHSSFEHDFYPFKVMDRFEKLTIAARYSISDKWYARGALPFVKNVRRSDAASIRKSGFSDISLLFGYNVSDLFASKKQGKMFIDMAAGINIPTGRFKANIYDDDVPMSFNAGTGAIGVKINPTIGFYKERFGILYSSDFLLNTASPGGYRYGHQLSQSILGYKAIDVFKARVRLEPNLGILYSIKGFDHYANGRKVRSTDIKSGNGIIGLIVRFDSIIVSTSIGIPIYDGGTTPETNIENTFSTQLTYLF